MGYRTTVILYNDQAHQWENDPDLGKKIASAMVEPYSPKSISYANIGYGAVVECTHMDSNILAIIKGSNFIPIVYSFWKQGTSLEDTKLELLRSWADQMGYRLSKKPTKTYIHGI